VRVLTGPFKWFNYCLVFPVFSGLLAVIRTYSQSRQAKSILIYFA
jgi:asparagine N-glycosylation enzyme membrane subunit Stt3